MAAPEKETDDKFVEIDGVKYKADPENKGEALAGGDGKFIPFEEKKEEKEEETDEEKEIREKKEKEEKEEEEKKDPPLRRSAKDYILDRKTKKIEQLKKEKEKEKKKDDDNDDGDEDLDEEERVTSKGKKAIVEEVEKIVGPIREKIGKDSADTKDETELQKVLNNPTYKSAKGMEDRIRKHMKAYPNAPVEFIYLGLAAKEMMLQTKRTKADEDAKGDVTGGHGKRTKELGPIPDVRGWSDEKIGELVQKIQTGQV